MRDYDIIRQACINQEGALKLKAMASFSVLEDVDMMIKKFFVRKENDHASIMLDVFGLLQGFFVGVDALYNLSIGSTKYKYHININQNAVLKQLKFIRNDIVGHPTHRTYQDGQVGFSLIDDKSVSREQLTYKTYIYKKNKEQNQYQRTIHFKELKEAYVKEKEILLKELTDFLKNDKDFKEIKPQINYIYQKALLNEYHKEDLKKLAEDFIKKAELSKDSNHRFLWRIRILESLFGWKEPKYQEIISFLILKQLAKLDEIISDTLNQSKTRFKIRLPKTIRQFYLFMDKQNNSKELLENINDLDHPLFTNDVKGLLKLSPPKRVKELLEWFLTLKEGTYAFSLGSVLKEYKKRK